MSQISGSRTLHRLVYCSRQKVLPADLEHEVGAIVRASIRNNRDLGLTGLLLAHNGWFLQSLEGGAAAVMTTYRRILDDPRHESSRVISAGPIEKRDFGDWNMCARGMGAADDAILATLSQGGQIECETLTAISALRLLKAVRGIQARTEASALA